MQVSQLIRCDGEKVRRSQSFTMLAGAPVFGQQGQLRGAEVPYEFTVASKVLPAGTYVFRVTDRGIQVQPASCQTLLAPIVTRLGGPPNFFRTALSSSTRWIAPVFSPRYGCLGPSEYFLHSHAERP